MKYRSTVALLLLFWFSSPLDAQDWPQINGPDRNGVVPQAPPLKAWPEAGPKTVWSFEVGQGFAGPAIKDNRLVIFHRPGQDYQVDVLDAANGQPIWTRKLPSNYGTRTMEGDAGPKAMPLITDNNRLILFGAGGNLFCLDFLTGETLWTLNVLKAYRSPKGYFGAGSSPIVVDNQVLLMVGGQDAAVVSFELETGKELWTSASDTASYSSPILANIGGKETAVFVMRTYVFGLNPKTGEEQFKEIFGRRGSNAIGAMPIIFDDKLFVNAAYRMGGKLWDLRDETPKEVWANDSFASHYSTPLFIEGHLYGTVGRVDFNDGMFRCVNAKTGKVKWSEEEFPVAHSLRFGDRILSLDSGGKLHLLEPSPKQFKRLASAKIFDGPSFAMPAFSNGKLYLRSNALGGKGSLICLQLIDPN